MTILCIETSTSVCSAAICKDGMPFKQCICREGSNHARLLPRYVEELLSLARDHRLRIEAVALSEGPGSYTGLRIGTSTAKGLCYGLAVPLIPVPTLQVLCESARQQKGISGLLCPMIDARRMEVYTTDAHSKARSIIVENEASLYSGEEDIYYFGDGAMKCQKIFTKPNWHYLPNILPEAQYVGTLAENLSPITDIAYYEPYYLKEFIAAHSHVKGLN